MARVVQTGWWVCKSFSPKGLHQAFGGAAQIGGGTLATGAEVGKGGSDKLWAVPKVLQYSY